jgi:hypothetical protein
MSVVGREREVEILHEALSSKKSELISVYGRRRVGKTFLIREVLSKHMVFDVTGLHNGTQQEQLQNFHRQLSLRDKRFARRNVPDQWQDAFALLEALIERSRSTRKKVIFIDEFPWMATRRSRFLMWFENFWNSFCTKRKDIVVVICGSAASYMVKNILRNKGGLHNRVTRLIRLEPFNLYETELFLKSRKIQFGKYDVLQLYMALGGIPHYLDKIRKGSSVAQNIDRLCFAKGGELANEFQEVLASLFTDSETHMMMIKVLAETRKGLSRMELLQKCNLTYNGYTSNVLDELTDSGFVTKYQPYAKKERGSLFRLTDEYCMFYLKFIRHHKGQGAGTWNKLTAKQTWKTWAGFTFESICIKHVPQIKSALGIAGVFSLHSSWQNEHAQIDLVIDRDDNRINLCEMKFSNGPFLITKEYYTKLKNKQSQFLRDTGKRKGVFYTFITTYGITQNSYSLQMAENDIKIESLFLKEE